MKTITKIMLFAVLLTATTTTFAQDRGYKHGSVWSIGFIKTGANMSMDYIKSLKTTWKAVNDEAVKQGLILSYKILEGAAANPDDWNIMLMQEYKNMGAMDGNEDKWDALEKKVVGNEDAQKKLNETRVNMRTIYGGKLLREIIYN
jgi:hypothetical protein